MRAKPAALILLAVVAGCGCAGLIVRDSDPPGRRHAVSATRLALTGLSLSVFPKLQAEFEESERQRLAEQAARDAAARFRRRWLHRILAARDAAELSAVFGGPPRGCRPGAAGSEICVWTTQALLVRAVQAPAIPTGRLDLPDDSVTGEQLVIAACELPTGGGARDPHRCDVAFW